MERPHATVIPNLVSQAGLNALCSHRSADVVILDPISNFAPEVWALEATCKPRYYLINNVNLPDHAGWAKEWLLLRGNFAELASGAVTDYRAYANAQKLHGNQRMGDIYEARGWVLLRRRP